jgi:hypothetical protein
MVNRRAERECRGRPATADALADRAPDPQFVRHRESLLELKAQSHRGGYATRRPRSARNGSGRRSIGRMARGRKFIKDMKTISIPPAKML